MNRPSLVASILALLLAATLAFAACSRVPAPSPSPTISSGVRGASLIVGGPVPGGPRPDPGVWIAVHRGSLHGPLVAQTRADLQGNFAIDLEPGRYTLVHISLMAGPKTVTVLPNEWVSVKLVISAL